MEADRRLSPDPELPALGDLTPVPSESRRLGLAPGPLQLVRAAPRGSGHLLLEYEDADGAAVAGQWLADPDDLLRVARGTARAAVAGSGLARVLLQPRGADRKLTALASLVETPGATLLAHRPEQRASVRRTTARGELYLKVLRPQRARLVAERTRVARRLARRCFAVPEAITHHRGSGVLVSAALPGRALHELLAGPRPPLAEAQAAGSALRWLHAAPPPQDLPRHGPAEEAGVIERWSRRIEPWAPAVAARVAAAGGDTLARLHDEPATVVAPLHRDLHDKQILIDSELGVGLLDLDTLAVGEPALDLANLLVHLELRALQGLCSADRARSVTDALMHGYQPSCAVLARSAVYADAARLRLACVYALRPRWVELSGSLLDAVGEPAPASSRLSAAS